MASLIPPTIIRLDRSHAAPYRALMLEAYRQHPDAFTSSVTDRLALPLSWWEARLSPDPQSTSLVLGAILNDQLVGVAGLSFETREKIRHKATLFGMIVCPSQRGQGLGRRLVEAALNQARERPGLRLVGLTVSEGNAAAQGLYESCGFVAFGTEPLAIRVAGRFIAKVHMCCDLGTHPEGD